MKTTPRNRLIVRSKIVLKSDLQMINRNLCLRKSEKRKKRKKKFGDGKYFLGIFLFNNYYYFILFSQRWEEKKYADGRKWTKLEHKGPLFEPDYVPLPDNIEFFYNSEKIKLNISAEEVMTFYAKMLDHDYTQKDAFNTNFFNDWRKVSTFKI